MKALMHSSEDAMDKLTMTDCPTQQLIDQVAVVYGDFHTALTRCVERGFGKEVAKGIFVISNQGVQNLPQDTLEQVQSLSVALWHLKDVREVLEKGGSAPELEALMHSCEKAMDKLTTIGCPTELLINQELAKVIFVTSKKGGLSTIDALYGNAPDSIILLVLTSVKAVRHAAKAAHAARAEQ
ncbi:hypothetical protein COCOBI_05-0390 [Coccomyxa sp. Obi]|nr:hypothetical protein COCOBI_05-0390 [Coccomyxa sp. Obi]